jgi:hypothetical protein
METWPTHISKSIINLHFTPIFCRYCVWINSIIKILICCSWDLQQLILCLRVGDLTRPVRLHSWHNFSLESFGQRNGNVLFKPFVTIKKSLTWSKLYSNSGQRKLWSIKLWKTIMFSKLEWTLMWISQSQFLFEMMQCYWQNKSTW